MQQPFPNPSTANSNSTGTLLQYLSKHTTSCPCRSAAVQQPFPNPSTASSNSTGTLMRYLSKHTTPHLALAAVSPLQTQAPQVAIAQAFNTFHNISHLALAAVSPFPNPSTANSSSTGTLLQYLSKHTTPHLALAAVSPLQTQAPQVAIAQALNTFQNTPHLALAAVSPLQSQAPQGEAIAQPAGPEHSIPQHPHFARLGCLLHESSRHARKNEKSDALNKITNARAQISTMLTHNGC